MSRDKRGVVNPVVGGSSPPATASGDHPSSTHDLRLRQMMYAIAVVTTVTLLKREGAENASTCRRGKKETTCMKKFDLTPGSIIRTVLSLGLIALSLFLAVPAANAQLIISEFRLRGPSGANDEFIEIYNNSGADHTVAGGGTGYGVAASDGVARCVIPNGTVIPNKGHYLCVNSVAYSLASYPAGNGTTATGDATYTTDIPDNAGIAIFNTSVAANFVLANRLDAVGSTSEANTLYKEGTGYPALTPFSIDYAFYRDNCGKSGSITTMGPCTISTPKDTNNNAVDFIFVDTNGTSAGAGQRLGAPGPENLSSPIERNATFAANLIDASVASSSPSESRAGLHVRSAEQLDLRNARHSAPVREQHRWERNAAPLPRHRHHDVPCSIRSRGYASTHLHVGRRCRHQRRGDLLCDRCSCNASLHGDRSGEHSGAAALAAERRRVQQQHVGGHRHARDSAGERCIPQPALPARPSADRQLQVLHQRRSAAVTQPSRAFNPRPPGSPGGPFFLCAC